MIFGVLRVRVRTERNCQQKLITNVPTKTKCNIELKFQKPQTFRNAKANTTPSLVILETKSFNSDTDSLRFCVIAEYSCVV